MQYIATYNPAGSFWKSFFHTFTARRLFFFFIITLAVLFLMYIYLINAAIRNVVTYGHLQSQVNDLTLHVDSLQSKYLAEESAISLSMAYTEGYKDASALQFIAPVAPGASVALSYNHH